MLGSVGTAGQAEKCDGIDYDYALVIADEVDGSSSSESYCTVEERFADSLGVQEGDQLRIGSFEREADRLYPEKLFTVTAVERDQFAVVRANGGDLAEVGIRRLDVGRVSATVLHPCHDAYEAADEHEEFVETTYGDVDDGGSFVVLAPHGGFETNTHLQAEVAADEAGVPAWICYGDSEDVVDGTFEPFARWHVTSTEISERSFPALRDVERAGFETALSFHGQSFDDGEKEYVGVGGRATELRDAVASALESTVSDLDVEVRDCGVDDCEYDGTAETNVVNDVTTSDAGGVQVEQPLGLRKDRHEEVARVAAEAMQDALE